MSNLLESVKRLTQIIVDDDILASEMDSYAVEQLLLSGKYTKEQVQTCKNEENEHELVALEYWSYTSQFYRKLLTATAAAFN